MKDLLLSVSDQMVQRIGFLPVVGDLTHAAAWGLFLFLLIKLVRVRSRFVGLLAAIFVLALLLRLWLPPWAPLHANELGIADLGRLVLPFDRWNRPEFSYWDPYGDGYRQLFGILIRSWHGGPDAALALTAILSALAVFPLGLFVAAALNEPAGLFAAFALAVLPAHIALSLSESPMGLAGTLFLTSLALLWDAPEQPEERRRASYGAGLLALALASELSVPTLVLPIVALLILLPRLAPVLIRDGRLWFGPFMLSAALVLQHVAYAGRSLVEALTQRGDSVLLSLHRTFAGDLDPRNAFLNPSLLSLAVRWLVVAGALVLLFRRPFLTVGVAVGAWLILGVGKSVDASRTDLIRYQTDGLVLLLVLASGVLLLIPAARRTWQFAGAGLLAVVVAITSGKALAERRSVPFPAAAYELVRHNAALIPNGATIHIPPRHPPAAPIGDFPEYVLRDRGQHVGVEEDGSVVGGPDCFIWLGPQCFSFSWMDARDPISAALPFGDARLRRECQPLAARIDPKQSPLFSARLPVPFPEDEYLRVPGHPAVGLYRCQ